MKNVSITRGGKTLFCLMLLMTASMLLSSAAYAASDMTWLRTNGGSQVAAGGNCRFIAVAKHDDRYIMTEDTWGGGTYYDTNLGYILGGGIGYARTDSAAWPSGWIISPATDAYNIWVSSIADQQSGTAEGVIGLASGFTTPGTYASPLQLGPTLVNYMAEPANFGAYPGNGKVYLEWAAVAGATKYGIFKAISAESYGIYYKVATTEGLFYLDEAAVTNETKYAYLIVPMNAANWYGVHTNQAEVKPTSINTPTITINPATGPVGTLVTITGSYFGSASGTVEFNGIKATNVDWSQVSSGIVTAEVPVGTTTGNVYLISSNKLVSDAKLFTIGGASVPDIISVTSEVYQGDTATLYVVGTNTTFGSTSATIEGAGVTINSVNVDDTTHARVNITVSTNAPIAFPTGRTIRLVTGTEIATGEALVIIKAPKIDTVSPGGGVRGNVIYPVTVNGTGTHFIMGTAVSFSNSTTVTAEVTAATATSATLRIWINIAAVTSPPDPGTITMTTVIPGAGTEIVSGIGKFMVAGGAYPNISTISPGTGNRSATGITLTGTLFGTTQGEVHFGATPIHATIESWNDTTIMFTVPYNAIRAVNEVSVMVGLQETNKINFTVNSATSIVPNPLGRFPGGPYTINITGTNTLFTPTSTINFSGGITEANTVYVSPTLMRVDITIPGGETPGDHTITLLSNNAYGEIYTYTTFVVEGATAEAVAKVYPNPFNPLIESITIEVNAATAGTVKISIYDQVGRKVWADAFVTAGGITDRSWTGYAFGKAVDNGVYFVYVTLDGKTIGRTKILVAKK